MEVFVDEKRKDFILEAFVEYVYLYRFVIRRNVLELQNREIMMVTENKNKNTTSMTRMVKKIAAASVMLLVVSAVFHLLSLNALATKGYAVKSAEEHIGELSQEYKQMRIDEARMVSLYRVESAVSRLSLEPSGEAESVYASGRFAFRAISSMRE